ncbi:hypothetical protein SLEP1_g14515 [Rubroshorea leprosula]|uniref:Uncharacterized protein n=1 Tax=Rubroshorea leprosula TaxID=152421 RepID=A0AAV5IS83_9ROSI|nr:hypothetical protein SLEP1_g14515 [Rubroshorea leprosula]
MTGRSSIASGKRHFSFSLLPSSFFLSLFPLLLCLIRCQFVPDLRKIHEKLSLMMRLTLESISFFGMGGIGNFVSYLLRWNIELGVVLQ